MLHPVPVLKESPSQTAGPYVHIGMTPNFCGITGVINEDTGKTMLGEGYNGPRIALRGRIIDGSGSPVNDAVLEIWQADADGNFPQPTDQPPLFTGWGRQPTQNDGSFHFDTVKPGRVKAPDGSLMAPHISVWIVARGVNIGLQTRVYFDDEAEANSTDYVLNKIMDPRRRGTLIAKRDDVDGTVAYHLDIRLQGEDETVFFDI
jgi:protocatechuate 3,4-dioxygenase alpha subunit